jgi:hypothetical protein
MKITKQFFRYTPRKKRGYGRPRNRWNAEAEQDNLECFKIKKKNIITMVMTK